MTEVHDVAIIGAGPVGSTLATLTARGGLSTVVLERDVDVYQLPRAAHFDAETARTFRDIGVWHPEADWTIAQRGMDFLSAPSFGISDATVDGAGFLSTDGSHDDGCLDGLHQDRWLIVADTHMELPEEIVRGVGAIIVRASGDGAARRQLNRCASDVVIVRPDRIVFGWGAEGLDALDAFRRRFRMG